VTAVEHDVIDLSVSDELAPVTEIGTAARPRRSRWRRIAGLSLVGLGVFVIGFLVFEFAVSGLVEGRSQRVLLREFRSLSNGGAASTLDWVPQPGDPVGVLSIPRLGLSTVVVQGTTSQQTSRGPGHYRGSSLPGRPGNSVIVGRRTTFGAPFRHVDQLRSGDLITVSTGVGAFTYKVAEVRQLRPGDPDVLGPSRTDRLTLVTSDPPYAATGRLAVLATLIGRPAAEPAAQTTFVAANESGLQGEAGAIPAILVFGELLIMAVVGAFWIARRISGRVAWLLGVPLVMALAWAVYLAMNRLLPATL